MPDKQHFYRKVEDQRDPNQTPAMEASGLLSRLLSGSMKSGTLREKDRQEIDAIGSRVQDYARDLLKGACLAESYPGQFEKAPDMALSSQLFRYGEDFFKRSKFKAFRIPSNYHHPYMEGSPHRQLSWVDIKKRLLANDFELLRKSLKLQGGGKLIGVLDDGRICLQDRGRIPVIYAFDKKGEEKIIMRNDLSGEACDSRESQLDEIEQNGGRFANEQEIRERVERDGFVLPTWRWGERYSDGPDALIKASWASELNEGERIRDPLIINDVFRNGDFMCQYAVLNAGRREDEGIAVLASDKCSPVVPRQQNHPARNLGAVRFLIG